MVPGGLAHPEVIDLTLLHVVMSVSGQLSLFWTVHDFFFFLHRNDSLSPDYSVFAYSQDWSHTLSLSEDLANRASQVNNKHLF